MNRKQPSYRRALAGFGLLAIVTALAAGCSEGEDGTDIVVGEGGDGGKNATSGGKSAGGKSAGGKSAGGKSGTANDTGGAMDGEAGESMGGTAGSGGSTVNGGGMAGSGTGGGGMAGGGMAGGGMAGGGMAGGGMAGGGMAGGGMAGGGMAGAGGVGTVVECGTASAECDTPTTPLCSTSCELVSTEACLACENGGDCFEFVDNCSLLATEADRELCYDVVQCIQLSNCYDGTNPLGFCFCGSVPAASCGSAPLTGEGAPDGECADLIIEGLMPVTTSAQVLGQLSAATSKPTGAAGSRLQCQKTAPSECRDECGFDTADRFPPLPE